MTSRPRFILFIIAVPLCMGFLTGCDRDNALSGENQARQSFENTVAAYARNASERDVRYDIRRTDSLVIPYQAIYYATCVAGNGNRIERRKIFNFRDGKWFVASVEHRDEDGNWAFGEWPGSEDQHPVEEKYYWDDAVKQGN